MQKEKITVANLKHEYCVATIKSKLSEFEGVQKVEVYYDKNLVGIEHEGKTAREMFAKKLASLGYPEATEENGLLTQLKNYLSCVDCVNVECDNFCFYPKVTKKTERFFSNTHDKNST